MVFVYHQGFQESYESKHDSILQMAEELKANSSVSNCVLNHETEFVKSFEHLQNDLAMFLTSTEIDEDFVKYVPFFFKFC